MFVSFTCEDMLRRRGYIVTIVLFDNVPYKVVSLLHRHHVPPILPSDSIVGTILDAPDNQPIVTMYRLPRMCGVNPYMHQTSSKLTAF